MTRRGVILLVLLATAGLMAASASSAGAFTRAQIVEESGLVRTATGWKLEGCKIDRIFATKKEVLAAVARELRLGGPEGPDHLGSVVSARGERFGVELDPGFGYCQQAVEDALSHVGHGGVPEGTPTTVANARAAIEALEFPIDLEQPSGENGVLVGRVHGSLGERFAFFLFVNRSAPEKMPGVAGYPGFLGPGNKGGLLGGGLVDGYIFGSRELPRRGETKAQFRQQSNIEFEVEEALCMQATGEDCGI